MDEHLTQKFQRKWIQIKKILNDAVGVISILENITKVLQTQN